MPEVNETFLNGKVAEASPLTAEILERIAGEYGTPTYVYDLTHVTAQVRKLKSAFPQARLHYAVKANANGALLRHLARLGLGAEALTLGELERSLRAGFGPSNTILGGPGFTPELAKRAVAAGVALVSLDSRGAYELFRPLLRRGTPGPKFLVRLNPGFDPHTHEHLATAASSSKFGSAAPKAALLAERVAEDGRLAGFHVHAGSMLTDAGVAEAVVRSLTPLYERFPGLEFVDFGGGFAAPSAPLRAFAAAYGDFSGRFGVTQILEPGRSLVAGAGRLLTRVLHVKASERRHVIADAGMADLLRPALYGARHPVSIVGEGRAPSGPSSQPRPTDVDGPLCENADRLALDAQLEGAREGDLLEVGQAGAYGFAMASNYGSSLRPAEVVWDGNRAVLARRRERPEDLWRLEDPEQPSPEGAP